MNMDNLIIHCPIDHVLSNILINHISVWQKMQFLYFHLVCSSPPVVSFHTNKMGSEAQQHVDKMAYRCTEELNFNEQVEEIDKIYV